MPDDVAQRRTDLLLKVQTVILLDKPLAEDVVWVCARLLGASIAQCSADSRVMFAHLDTMRMEIERSAVEEFRNLEKRN